MATWNTALEAHELGEVHLSGYEPCYIACLNDLDRRISTVLAEMAASGYNENVPPKLAEMLLEYSQLATALSTIESLDRVYEEDAEGSKRNPFLGMIRRIQRAKDVDEIYESLRRNWLLVFLSALFKQDLANSLRERFGNLSMTADRLLVGLAGGASMLVPMIIMAYATSLTARLVVVSVATIVFANFMALTSVSKENVVASTAAYAAVMVVFIGSAESA